MKPPITESTAPLFPDERVPRPRKSTLLAQTQARLQDMAANETAKLEKRLQRAHFAVGEIILNDPELLALVAPKLEPHLEKLGSARKVVDEHTANRAELDELKRLF